MTTVSRDDRGSDPYARTEASGAREERFRGESSEFGGYGGGGGDGGGSRGKVRDLAGEVIRYRAFCDTFGEDPDLLAASGISRPRFGEFALERVLGSGAKGHVLGGIHLKLNWEVAVKVVREDLDPSLSSADERARLLREAQALAKFDHPNIVRVTDAGEEDGLLYIAMENVRGRTLDEAQAGKTWQEIVELYLEAGRGLQAAHEREIIHRDFKPQNVLVREDGRVMVADFGLAMTLGIERDYRSRQHERRATDPDIVDARITLAGQSHGTPMYMPPEQFDGRADARSDLYAFSVSLFEALYGTAPFDARGWWQIMTAKTLGKPVPRPAGTKVPRWLDRLVRSGLEAKAEDRPQSMAEFLVALDHRARWRRRFRWGGAGVLCAAIVVPTAIAMAPDPCAGGEQELRGVWDKAMGSSLLSGAGAEEERARRAIKLFDGRATEWVESFSGICSATQHEGTQSPELHLVRMACLDQRRRELGVAASRVLRDPTSENLDEAIEVAARLPSAYACADETLIPRPPAEERATLEQVDKVLAEVQYAELAGDYPEGVSLAEKAVEAVTAVTYAPARARAHLALGRMRWLVSNQAGAKVSIEEALDIAERNGLDALSADASNLLTKVAGLTLHDAVRGSEWAKQTERKIARISRWRWNSITGPLGDWRRAELENNLGVLAHYADADYDTAVSHHLRALALRMSLPGDARLLIADSNLNLGAAYLMKGETKPAEEHTAESLRLNREVLGEEHGRLKEGALLPEGEHPRIADALFNGAMQKMAEGDLDAALQMAMRVLAIDKRLGGDARTDTANSHNLVSTIHERRGETAQAEEHARLYLEGVLANAEATPAEKATAYDRLGCVLREAERYDEALAEFQRGLDALPGTKHRDDMRASASLRNNRGSARTNIKEYEAADQDFKASLTVLADLPQGADDLRANANKGVGRVLLRMQRYADAVGPLERAVTLASSSGEEALAAEAQGLLAEALIVGILDAKRGRDLATKTLEYFKAQGHSEFVSDMESLLTRGELKEE